MVQFTEFKYILGMRERRVCELTDHCSEAGNRRHRNVVSVAVQLDGLVGKR